MPYSLIIDAHQDIMWNWLDLGRDPRESALDGREREAASDLPSVMGIRTTGLPEWLAGRIGIIFSSLYVMPSRQRQSHMFQQTYTSAEEAHDLVSRQLDAYLELAEQEPRLCVVTDINELEQVVSCWDSPDEEPVVGLVIQMEGADPITEPAEVHEWYTRGVRIVGPAWGATRYAGGTGEPGPLTPLGNQLLAQMEEQNMILDLSHMAERAFYDALESYSGPLIASHSNPRKFNPTDRSLSDDMIRRLVGRQGVMGIVPFNAFLKPGWSEGEPKDEVSIRHVVDAIDHVAQLAGSSAHVGLGTDFDGGFGADSIPAEMDTIADLPLIAEALSDRGFSDPDIVGVMNGNWLRILRSSLP